MSSRNKRGLLGSSAQDQISLQTFILNEIQPDRHCEQMASREGEEIGNVDLSSSCLPHYESLQSGLSIDMQNMQLVAEREPKLSNT